ncbi:MAG: signal peptidase II [Methylacidiphilales bacterium]|nr:signal peptidase II [Candidatus Methylacidiphilales bacterium]MDW8349283.1 signal peptidase II [Verrucomicrobiae bacterium]
MRFSPSPPHLICILTFLIALASDQATKHWAWHVLRLSAPIPIFPPHLHFTFAQNTGISFGLFQGNNSALILLTTALILLSLFIVRQLPWSHPITPIFTALFFAGAVGNLIDRIQFHGVIDFIDIHIPWIQYRWPTFNLADTFICVAVGLFILQQIFFLPRSIPKGFSLFEVMLAVTIFALVVMALAQALKSSIESTTLIQREFIVRQLLQNALAAARVEPLRTGSFPIKTDDPDYTLEKRVEQLNWQNQDQQPLQGLYQITITASWKEGNDSQQAQASLILYQP